MTLVLKKDSGPEGLKRIAHIASKPGVYLMKNTSGEVIYVGKARSLRKRLAAYFGAAAKLDPKSEVLVKQIAEIETVITETEKEALILESSLIKRHRPRYNVILKDDKRYPSLRLDVAEPYPHLAIVRKIRKDGALYFGPYSSALSVRQTMKFIDKTFKLRKCSAKTFRQSKRPCLHHQMERCLAPCCLNIEPGEYQRIVREVVLFLKGRTPELINRIKAAMTAAAQRHEYEKAAVLRDKYQALERTLEKQVVVLTDFKDRDVLALARSDETSLIVLLSVRGGFLLSSRTFTFQQTLASDAEILVAFMRQYYENAHILPPEILIDRSVEDRSFLEEWLTNLAGHAVKIRCPLRGAKLRLLKISRQNATQALQEHLAATRLQMDILERLQGRLKLRRLPLRIECFDNSNLGGTEPVASRVVFEKGEMKKSHYRRYRIKTVARQDDYAYLAEILQRRFGKGAASTPLPDLLMVDGGKGQLNIALSVLHGLQLDDVFDVAGIAKPDPARGEREDKIYRPGQANAVAWGRDQDVLLFLQRIRDEAHRFAVAFQRQRRGKRSLHSVLDKIPGVGPKRKAALFKHLGNIQNIKSASVAVLSQVPGLSRKVAEAIRQQLGGDDDVRAPQTPPNR